MNGHSDQHPDPGGEAAARAAQLAAMVVSVAEAAARLRAHRQSAAHAAAEQDASARRAVAAAEAASARIVYGAALDDAWRRQASTSELLDSWSAAGDYAASDPLARLTTERVEERLRQLHPEAMAAFDATRAAGFPPEDCLDVAAFLWRGEYGLDPIGTPVARRLADFERGRAAAERGTDDVLATAGVDEATAGLAASAGSDGRAARYGAAGHLPAGNDPLVVVGQAFPVDIHTAMATAPRAAKERLALVAAPQHRQLTATPHIPRSAR
ncbi:hypothetical protein [Kineosporia sp. R_H_3]|uniref:hypothetical protein n=1 Tax=Kineosporia sp. R_H_3 TaxID=1961848 RepID=UPI000B4B2599|nr:hypothetical protein [Kineosporia sp. R_H_3]